MITLAQAKAARKLLGWSRIDVALRLDVDKRTVAALERQEYPPWDVDLDKLRQIFEAAGVEFVGVEVNIRLKPKAR
jgi:transcriptional regulator with XRE-family HTH domain